MHAHTPLITTLVIALVLAFALGALAHRLRLSPLVGYLLAGVAVGPFTPGYVADQALALELAEIGVILLMFGVGMHFSLQDLLSVKSIAIPGALVQITAATVLGASLAWALDWGIGAALIFGLSLSVASTVVLLRALETRNSIDSAEGRIAVGWLIVEDLAMVLALVLLPALADVLRGDEGGGFNTGSLLVSIGLTLTKVAAFIALMLIVGRRAIPWLLHHVAQSGSRELFTLAVLAIGLGVAYGSAKLFGVSFALGAFFAGMVLMESELSHRAAEESLPLRDAFAVLFFVSVGMLFDPSSLLTHPLQVLATVLIIIVGKSMAAYAIVRLFGHSSRTALTISASLAQIGEFSFILAALGIQLQILPAEAQNLIVTGAILSIFVNPLCFITVDRLLRRQSSALATSATTSAVDSQTLHGHAVVVGYGRVGSVIAGELAASGHPTLVVEERPALAEQARKAGFRVIAGNCTRPEPIEGAGFDRARWLFVAVPNGFSAAGLIKSARALNPELRIVARAHSDAEAANLLSVGAHQVVMGEHEIALGMLKHAAAPLSTEPA